MITNEFPVTWEVYRSWGLESALKGTRLKFAIIWILDAILMLGLSIWSGGNTILNVLFIYCVYRAFFRWLVMTYFQYRALGEQYGTSSWMRRIYFEEEEIRVEECMITVKYAYSDVAKMEERGNKVWLHMKNKMVVRLYKDCFGDSSWEECRFILEQKCLDMGKEKKF